MKHVTFILALFLGIVSCKPSSKSDVGIPSETRPEITKDTSAADTPMVNTDTAVIQQTHWQKTKDIRGTDNQIDTSNYDPSALPTKKYESPKINPKISSHVCSPNFNVISKPQQTTHFYYVTGFTAGEFKCWAELENHGVSICNEQPCTIYYLDSPTITVNQSASNPIDASTLQKHGIGKFSHSGKFWEVNGARIWKRSDKAYGYYNTNNHFGG